MEYTPKEVLEYISEADVKFIRLALCDKTGKQKNIAIMPSELGKALEEGVEIDASPIEGFEGKIILKPDASTLCELPWRPQHGRVVHFFCDVMSTDGKLIADYPRNILKSKSFGASTAVIDQSFYLFALDENGGATKVTHDKAGYMDIAPDDKGENVRREICLTLERMGITPVGSHHERGPGQHIVNCAPAKLLTAADNAVTYRAVVRTIAAQYGLFADFSSSPVSGAPENFVRLTVDGKAEPGEHFGKDPYILLAEYCR